MRSKKDERTETEREIDDFLSQFDSPEDGSSADYSTYLEPENLSGNSGQSFSWRDVGTSDAAKEIRPEDLGIEFLQEDTAVITSAPASVEASSPREEMDKTVTYHKAGRKSRRKKAARKAGSVRSDKAHKTDHIETAAEDVKAADTSASAVPAEVSEPAKVTDPADKTDAAPGSAEITGKANAENDAVSDTASGTADSEESSSSEETVTEETVTAETVTKETAETAETAAKETGKADKDEAEAAVEVISEETEAAEDTADKTSAADKDDKVDEASASDAPDVSDTAESIENITEEAPKKPDISAILASKIAESKKAVKKKKKKTARRPVQKAPPESSSAPDTVSEPKDENVDEAAPHTDADTAKKKVRKPVRKAGVVTTKIRGSAVRLRSRVRSGVRSGVTRFKRIKGDRTLPEFLFMKKNPDYDPEQGDTYVKDGKTIRNRKNRISFAKILMNIAAVFAVFVLAGAVYALGCIISAPKYNYKDIYSAVDTASIVYDDQEKPIDNVFYTENRKVIKYKDMPEDLINSFVAIEDKTFWKHHGFNWTRMIGAIISSLTGNGRISGTSTITQQLARNVYLADTKSVRSIKRKLLEMYYASRIEHNLSKEEIVEAYLNTIYLGHGCYGVNAAARTYFSKDVKDLDLIECASLAALPQSPDTYALLKLGSEAQNARDSKVVATEPDTIVTNDISKERRQLTLDLMLDQGMITQKEHDKVYDLRLNDFINPSITNSGSVYSYFHEYLVDTIIADLMDQKGMSYEDAERTVYTKGLQIYSTIDSTAQKVIVDEFADESNFPYITAPLDGDGNMLNSEGDISLYKYENDFDEDGNFTLSGEAGDVSVNSDGSVTITKGHKLHIYETEVEDGTDYSIEFKPYYLYNDEDILYTISGGYVNIPMGYKSLDTDGNVVVSADFFSDPDYADNVKIDGKDLILKPGIYTLSSRSRQPQAAMTIVGVGTGEVKAMVGGRTSGGQKLLNRSLNARQPGSSIKPLAVYGAALQKSYDLNKEGKKWKFTDYGIDRQGTKGWGDYITTYSSVEDEKTKIEGRYWPENYNHSFSGKNTFMTAIQKSINTCAVKIELQVGDDYSVNQLKKFGLSTVQDDTSNPVNDVNPAALALGAMTQGVQPLEMALAYASFPAGGKVNTPVCYYKVLDRNGDVLLEGKSEQTEALNDGVAWIMTNVLQSVVKSNNYMYVSDVQPGGKTGTTNDQYDIWFDGFTPSYAGSLWIGTDENVEMSSMSTPAANLWGKIMDQIPNAKKGEYLPQPSEVIYTSGCYFTKGTETGLTSWSDAEARKKARERAKKAAYEKWLKERENHKVLVPAVTQEVDDTSKPIYGQEQVIIGYNKKQVEVPIYRTEVDPVTGLPVQVLDHYEVQVVDDPASPIYETRQTVIGYEKITVVVQPEHWEYEPGWRDGDFKYSGDD